MKNSPKFDVDDFSFKQLLKELGSIAWRLSHEHDSPYSAAIIRKARDLLKIMESK
jgi:hypothetical protein